MINEFGTSSNINSESITLDEIKNSIKEVEAFKASGVLDYFNNSTFKYAGIDIVETPVKMVPVVQVSEDFEWLTDESKERLNNQLIGLLGYKELCAVPKDTAYIINYGIGPIVMRPEMAAVLQNVNTLV